jgi:hypothetical protein
MAQVAADDALGGSNGSSVQLRFRLKEAVSADESSR